MQAHGHHLGRARLPFGIERVECIGQVGFEIRARHPTRRGGKTHVVTFERVRDHQLITRAEFPPMRQVIVIAVGNVIKAAFFGDKAHGIDAAPPRIPAARAGPRNLSVQAHRLGDGGAFLGLGHVLVFDPFQAMAGDFPACLLHGGHLFGAAREG